MTIRQEMLSAARASTALLGDQGTQAVRQYFLRQQGADGGFADLAGKSDLYYTVFALEGLAALESPGDTAPTAPEFIQRLGGYLQTHGDGEGLDFVHLCCLVRAWAGVGGPPDKALARRLARRLGEHRCDDGGFGQFGRARYGTAYGCFLATGAMQELGDAPIDSQGLLNCLQALRTADGAYSNERGRTVGLTSATAAACTVMRHLNQPPPDGMANWLLDRRKGDGFLAMPEAPLPDMLSTATALHALAGLGVQTEMMAEAISTFVTSLLCDNGGFRGNWIEQRADCEYTFYALLALGSVAR